MAWGPPLTPVADRKRKREAASTHGWVILTAPGQSFPEWHAWQYFGVCFTGIGTKWLDLVTEMRGHLSRYWTAAHLAMHGATVVIGCRSPDKCEKAKEEIHAMLGPGGGGQVVPGLVDLADLASVTEHCLRANRFEST